MNSTHLVPHGCLANGRVNLADVLNSGAVENSFSNVSSSQRATGLTDYFKLAWVVKDPDNGALYDSETYQDKPTKSVGDDDYVVYWLSDARTANTQSALAAEAATADKVGSAYIAADITAATKTIDFTYKHANLVPGGADEIFRDGEKIRICSHTDALATDGTEETLTLDGDPVQVAGLTYRATVVEDIANSYTNNGKVRISSVIAPGTVQPTVDDTPGFTVTTAGDGDYDDASYPLILDNIGTPDEDITITFTDATSFTAVGDSLGALGSGTTAADFSPLNTAGSVNRPYFTLEAAGFSGTWAAGDTITFTLHGAATYEGCKRVVKAGAASLSNNLTTSVFGGEAN